MGSVGLDYLAAVAAFPKPDDKLRTERLEVREAEEERERRGSCSLHFSFLFNLPLLCLLFRPRAAATAPTP